MRIASAALPLLQHHLTVIFGKNIPPAPDFSLLVPSLKRDGNARCRTIWSKPKSLDWYTNIVANMSSKEFMEHFRVSRSTFNFLVEKLRPALQKMDTNMRPAIEVERRVAMSLHFLASCEEYRVLGSLFGSGTSTCNDIVKEFVQAVNTVLLKEYISFPQTTEDLKRSCSEFESILGFPQCVGAIDGSHIPVNAPSDDSVSYYCYKGYCSSILFAVVDARCRYIYISVGNPGKNNDAYLYTISSIKEILDSSFFDTYEREMAGEKVPVCIMGDSAFPLQRHLLKPYPEHCGLDDIEYNFNKVFCGGRRIVENAFGRTKARFRIVYKKMEADIWFCDEIIKACCVLHNICVERNETCPREWVLRAQKDNDEIIQSATKRSTTVGDNGPGNKVRDAIAAWLYANKAHD